MRIQTDPLPHRDIWWIHGESRPGMRRALNGLTRFIATPRVSKYRVFVWFNAATIPDSALYAIARDDDTTFGILHSRFHELWALLRVGSRLGLDIAGFDRQAADITDPVAIGTVLAKVQAHLIINAAAYTAVDKAESNVERAFAINRDGVANLARTGLPLIHISTDYVFDGRKRGAYVETDPVAPLGGPARALKPSPRATIPRRPRAPPIH